MASRASTFLCPGVKPAAAAASPPLLPAPWGAPPVYPGGAPPTYPGGGFLDADGEEEEEADSLAAFLLAEETLCGSIEITGPLE